MARQRKTTKIGRWVHYASVEDFTAAVKASSARDQAGRPEWMGDTWDGAMDKAENGDLSAVDKAEQILDAIDSDLDVAGLRPQWGDSVVGAYPNVPAFLANSPETMRSRVYVPANAGPVTIYYSPSCHGSLDSNTLQKRGFAVLALVLALQRVRPVRVRIYTCYGMDTDHTIDIRTEPMVLAEAAHCLAATSFFRALSFCLAGSGGWDGSWPDWYHIASGSTSRLDAAIREQVKADPDDIIIPPMGPEDLSHSEMINHPAQWINGILGAYRAQ